MNGSSSSITPPRLKSYAEALRWLLDQTRTLAEERRTQVLESEDERDVFITLTALLRSMILYGNAVHELSKSGLGEAAPPLVRTMYEILMDYEQVAGSSSPKRQVLKMRMSGVIDLKRYYELLLSRGNEEAAENVRKAEGILAALREEDPNAYEGLQRGQHRNHWSGKSKRQMEQEMSRALLYQPLSWEAHAVAAPLRDFSIPDSEKQSSIVFGRDESPEELGELQSYGALSILFRLWNNYATRYGLRTIKGPAKDGPQTGGKPASQNGEGP